jgi:hypothetical protein
VNTFPVSSEGSTKLKIRNKHRARNPNDQNALVFLLSDFGFVSDFVLRTSDLRSASTRDMISGLLDLGHVAAGWQPCR